MSIEARCNICGELSGLRLNFGQDREAEQEYHENYLCIVCKELRAGT